MTFGMLDLRARPALLRHHATRDGEKSRVRDHPVEGTHREPLDVPGPHQRLEGLDERIAGVPAKRFGQLVRLDDGGHVRDEDAARTEHARDGLKAAQTPTVATDLISSTRWNVAMIASVSCCGVQHWVAFPREVGAAMSSRR